MGVEMDRKTTPVYRNYCDLAGIKTADFHGWELPLHFSQGISAEHTAVRTAAGLFDVSHMGEIFIEGEQAEWYLDQLITGSVLSMKSGEVKYTFLCYPDGNVADDIIVYKCSDTRFLLVVNAGNREKDYSWITRDNPVAQSQSSLPVIKDQSDAWAQLALQGPKSEQLLTELIPEVRDIGYFTFRDDLFYDEIPLLVSRTGYTGEDGFEIYLNAEDGGTFWDLLVQAGAQPCGLGARDTLRLEAKFPLYGHEISESITPLEANLSVFTDLEKSYFIGKEALARQKEQGIPRTLRGIEMIEPGVPREGCRVFSGENQLGTVTSGTKSPTLNKFIALVLIERGSGLKIGDELEIEIHRKRKRARLVKTPFYKKTGRS